MKQTSLLSWIISLTCSLFIGFPSVSLPGSHLAISEILATECHALNLTVAEGFREQGTFHQIQSFVVTSVGMVTLVNDDLKIWNPACTEAYYLTIDAGIYFLETSSRLGEIQAIIVTQPYTVVSVQSGMREARFIYYEDHWYMWWSKDKMLA